MLITEIQEDSFVKKSSSSYDLSILVGVDRFFYMVTDTQQNLLVLRSYMFEEQANSFAAIKQPFSKAFQNDKILQLPFAKTRLAFINSLTTLVPERLFVPEKKELYLHHLIRLQEEHRILVNPLPSLDTYLVFAIEQSILKMMESSFPKATFYHSSTPFLLGCKRQMEHQDGSHIFLNVKDGLLQTVLYEGNKLLFSNTFPYQSSKDFIYFVMLIFDQFQLKPASTPISLSGMIERDSEIYQHLYRYIRHINFFKPPSFTHFGRLGQELKPYYYYDLFCLKLL